MNEVEWQNLKLRFLRIIHDKFVKQINNPRNSYLQSIEFAGDIEDVCKGFCDAASDELKETFEKAWRYDDLCS